jgi:hypothetical protein
VSPLARPLGLPGLDWIFLAAMLLACVTITQLMTRRFVRRFGESCPALW